LTQFQNFSGLLILAPGLELEVAPKFLGEVKGWREDFFFLAMLSQHGRLIDNENLRSGSQKNSDMSTLIGRSLVDMYWRNQRRPLKSYRRFNQTDFALEGDFDPEDLLIPSAEGFHQVVTSFSRSNPYNAIIRAAAEQLVPLVSDSDTRARLERVIQHLPHQLVPSRLRNQKLPSRARSWRPVYDLSLDILQGLSGSYDPKNAIAPGFAMQTWQVWEFLVTISLRSAFGGKNVLTQGKKKLGDRFSNSKSSILNVCPDVQLNIPTEQGNRKVIVDAKYKGHVEYKTLSVSNSDIYEALAFSRASSIKDIVLVYPRKFSLTDAYKHEVGNSTEFTEIIVGDIKIRAFELGVC